VINKQSVNVFFLLFISMTLFAQAPKWAETNSHKNYPSSKYLLGVGIADEKTQAVELARADVAKQIQVKIESELETMEQEIGDDNKHSVRSEITSRTKSVVSETVIGIEIIETTRVKGKYYALAVLNKQNYLTGLEQNMDDISSATTQYIQSARELVRQGNVFAAIDNYISAQNEIPDFYVKRGLYTALSGKYYGDKNTLSPAVIQAEIRTLFSEIHINMISGDNQQGRTGSVLSAPLVAKIYYSDESGQEFGLRQFPVIVKYSNGEIIGKPKTDDSGLVSVKVIASPSRAVVFIPDFKTILNQFRDELPKIQAIANYTLLSSNISVSINILNVAGQPDHELNKTVGGLANENGYKTDSAAPIQIQGQATITDEKIINSPAGKQYFIETELRLSLIDINSGIHLASITGLGKGLAIGSREQAVLKSSENIVFSKSKFAAFLQAANKP